MLTNYNPKRILVIAVPSLGDVLLTTPLIESLQSRFPNSTIDILTREESKSICQIIPHINKVVTFNYKSKIISYLKMIFSILRKYDLAISTSTSDRSTLSSFYAAKKRVGVLPKKRAEDWWKKFLVQNFIIADSNIHTLTQNLKLVEKLGLNKEYNLDLNTIEKFKYELPEEYTVVHCFSKGEHKNLDKDFWIEKITELINDNQTIVLTSGPNKDEIARVNEIANNFSSNIINLSGKLSFIELATLLSKANLYIGVDTCVTHIAALLGVKTIGYYGPTNTIKWSPWPKEYKKDTPPFNNTIGTSTVLNVTVEKYSKTTLS